MQNKYKIFKFAIFVISIYNLKKLGGPDPIRPKKSASKLIYQLQFCSK